MEKVSIIMRARNEERWISDTLHAVSNQLTNRAVEVVLVNNESTDSTVARAGAVFPGLKLVSVREYRPGLALNRGIEAATGSILVILSAHCPPANELWLENLIDMLVDPSVAAVYGRQLPTPQSTNLTRRELTNLFGVEPLLKSKDPFFHNANAAVKREVWDMVRFDEGVKNLEDRVWANAVLGLGWKIAYEPSAAVFHEDGLHTDKHTARVNGAITVIEKTSLSSEPDPIFVRSRPGRGAVAVVPIPGSERDLARFGNSLERIVADFSRCEGGLAIFGLATTESGKKFGADVGFNTSLNRPAGLAGTRSAKLYQWFQEQLDLNQVFPDEILISEMTETGRPDWLFDQMLRTFRASSFDTLIPGVVEKRPSWNLSTPSFDPITTVDIVKSARNGIGIGLPALCTVTRPGVLRQGFRLGGFLGFFTIKAAKLALQNQFHEAVVDGGNRK